MSALSVQSLTILSRTRQIVLPVTFELNHGEIFAILGETGSGKSLIGSAIMGLLPRGISAEGRLTIDGQTFSVMDRTRLHAYWAQKIFLLPQEPLNALAPLLPAYSHVAEQLPWPTAESKARGALLRMQLDMEDHHKRPFELSGGMAQRLIAAIATVTPAEILVVDEPTKGLDGDRREIVAELFKALRAEGRAIVLITHDINLARKVADRVAFLHEGNFIEVGATEQVLNSPATAYAQRYVASDPSTWGRRPFVRSSTPKVIEAQNLTIGAGGRVLAQGLSFHCHAGQISALLGRSGVGKTTLGRTLLGITPAFAGDVARACEEPGRRALQKLHQDPTRVFAPWQSIGRSLDDMKRLRGGEAATKALPMLLERFNLRKDLLERRPDQISGGEAQRLALARILALKPRFLVADEPTSRLDPPVQEEVLKLLREVVDESGLSVLLITHDRDVAFSVADRQMELTDASGRSAHLNDLTNRAPIFYGSVS